MKPRSVGLWSLWRRLMGLNPDLQRPCPFCHEIDRMELVCPLCREPLVAGDDRLEKGRMIAVIGSNAAGKSHYMATVLHQFLEVGVDGWKVKMSDEALARCRSELLGPLFEDRRELPATRPVLGPDFPLQLEHDSTGDKAVLVFRDVGGEALLSPESLQEMDFLHFADGVVLMVDPLAYQPPIDATPDWIRHDKEPVTRVLEVYSQVLQERRRLPQDRERALLPSQKFLAVVVTKADLVLPSTHWFWNVNGTAPTYERGFWENREMEDDAVRDWIVSNLGLAIPRLTREFADVSYFFVSSFGNRHPPGQSVLGKDLEPKRVHEPIFALLDRLMSEREDSAEDEVD